MRYLVKISELVKKDDMNILVGNLDTNPWFVAAERLVEPVVVSGEGIMLRANLSGLAFEPSPAGGIRAKIDFGFAFFQSGLNKCSDTDPRDIWDVNLAHGVGIPLRMMHVKMPGPDVSR